MKERWNRKLSGSVRRKWQYFFDNDVRTINEHIGNVFADEELEREAAIQKFRTVRQVGRWVLRDIEQGLVKNDPNAPDSRRYARYIPAWA